MSVPLTRRKCNSHAFDEMKFTMIVILSLILSFHLLIHDFSMLADIGKNKFYDLIYFENIIFMMNDNEVSKTYFLPIESDISH